ncbi:hypothetical protein [Marinobacter caseinilyticus]|uniref:hypothetical protein n=1 Tax=Marinobacter caseinilyticus TaxID=2692195 RepID=UPI00140B6EFC|nr:hypothetical protein [Marinobacter caseinilyticus]
METPLDTRPSAARPVHLDQHDSVRTHVCRRLSDEVERLERRIETLRLIQAPHTAIIITTYERMIDRKKGFMKNWGMAGNGSN